MWIDFTGIAMWLEQRFALGPQYRFARPEEPMEEPTETTDPKMIGAGRKHIVGGASTDGPAQRHDGRSDMERALYEKSSFQSESEADEGR